MLSLQRVTTDSLWVFCTKSNLSFRNLYSLSVITSCDIKPLNSLLDDYSTRLRTTNCFQQDNYLFLFSTVVDYSSADGFDYSSAVVSRLGNYLKNCHEKFKSMQLPMDGGFTTSCEPCSTQFWRIHISFIYKSTSTYNQNRERKVKIMK